MSTPNNQFFANFSHPELRVLDHDHIHAMVAGSTQPLFYSIKEDFDAAEVCEHLFQAMSTETKDRLIYEEVIVLAYERVIIPQYMVGDRADGGTREERLAAFAKYLTKMGSTLRDSPEWIRDYAAVNRDRIWKLCEVVPEPVHDSIKAALRSASTK